MAAFLQIDIPLVWFTLLARSPGVHDVSLHKRQLQSSFEVAVHNCILHIFEDECLLVGVQCKVILRRCRSPHLAHI